MRRLAAGALAVAIAAHAAADDAALAARVQRLAEELRCLVCQNETLADSQADLAVDLRRQIREQLAAGASEAQVRDYLVKRYGDFVLYRPPLKPATWLLWFGPFALLAAGIGIWLWQIAKRRNLAPEPPLADDERKRLEAALGGRAEDSP